MSGLREYESEVYYEAWRRGMDPERAVECADDCYWSGNSPTECVDDTARRDRSRREERAAYEQEEERRYYEACQQQEYERQMQEYQRQEQEAEEADRIAGAQS